VQAPVSAAGHCPRLHGDVGGITKGDSWHRRTGHGDAGGEERVVEGGGGMVDGGGEGRGGGGEGGVTGGGREGGCTEESMRTNGGGSIKGVQQYKGGAAV
jgi:hypothetical protein